MLPRTTQQLSELLDLGQWVPERWAAYQPLAGDALLFFLRRLPAERQLEIMAAQALLPAQAALEERVFALLHSCPTLHKLGQVMARDQRLPVELRRHLQRLETLPPSLSLADLAPLIHAELGERDDVELDSEPLAEASVAVILPFCWRPAQQPPVRGVFKLLKPGIERRLREDLSAWTALADFLTRRSEHYHLPPLDYRGTLDSVAALLLNEVEPGNEQANLDRARDFYADLPTVCVPRRLPLSTPRLTAMEFIPGEKITQPPLSPTAGRRVAETLVRALLAKPFWDRDGVFHADPHAGNLLLAPDGRLGLLDWSLTGSLAKAQREHIMQIALGALTADAGRICAAIAGLGTTIAADDPRLRAIVQQRLQVLDRGQPLGFEWLLSLLDEVARAAQPGFPRELVLFRKAMHSLIGIVEELAPAGALDQALLWSALQALATELPLRLWTPPLSRDLSSHLSSFDLWQAWLTAPLALGRYW
jgi:ubiquinone biosynthesis protein